MASTRLSRATRERGRRLIDEAKKLDPKAVAEVAAEVEREREKAEQFTGKK